MSELSMNNATVDSLSNGTYLPWYDQMSACQYSLLYLIPLGSFLFIVFILRVVWKPPAGPKFKLPKNVPTYGSTSAGQDEMNGASLKDVSVIEAGEVAGAYDMDWKKTFDFVFLISMIILFFLISIVTTIFRPDLWTNGEFWVFMLPKLGTMMTVSFLGGLLCRYFCAVDDTGYVMTTNSSIFKVNYTRKLQHFAAYLIPLILKPSAECNCGGPIALAWGDLFTLMGFFLLIKPIRERFTFFMLQFNALDRPEDRPHTLNWIVVGNVFPGFVLIIFFRWLFSSTTQSDLVFIIIFITGIGDGLAEPVGILFGKHKYSTSGFFSTRKYTRSWEGSACVFLSGMIFPALQYRNFDNATQLWLAMAILPPVVAYAEATAPHTMDTPVLMILTGAILYGIVQWF